MISNQAVIKKKPLEPFKFSLFPNRVSSQTVSVSVFRHWFFSLMEEKPTKTAFNLSDSRRKKRQLKAADLLTSSYL